jgi:hypothetical protein
LKERRHHTSHSSIAILGENLASSAMTSDSSIQKY